MEGRKNLLLFLLSIAWAVHNNGINGEHIPCSIGDKMVNHGEVVMTMPEKCTSLVCREGELVMDMLGDLHDTGCCMDLGRGLVPNGYERDGCLRLTCKDSKWIPDEVIQPCCGLCQLYSYSHFVTFDSHYFDWRGVCNYTLVQWSPTKEPNHGGIFAHMEVIVEMCSTIFSHTTYRNDPNTIINITRSSLEDLLIDVNSDTITIPEEGVLLINSSTGNTTVFAFRQNDCLVLVGTCRVGLRYCLTTLDIWVDPLLLNSVKGLCGPYNYDNSDDFTTPSGNVQPLDKRPKEYPETWRADSQNIPVCLMEGSTSGWNETKHYDECYNSSRHRDHCDRVLKEYLMAEPQVENYIDSCATDLCLATRNLRPTDDHMKLLDAISLDYVERIDEHLLFPRGDGKECSTTTIPVRIDDEDRR